ncbi:hypothetical protein CBD41_08420 [bacterium TMED181]|nr:MAG: hypothetical protein CBD41_08420 [bacterium TMED181]
MLLYRGYENGRPVKRKIKYEPTLYVTTPKESNYISLDGKAVAPVKMPDMREAKAWIQTNQHVAGRQIYGNIRHIPAFIQDEFPGDIQFDRNNINVTSIDIEVASDQGFPEPDQAIHEITAITIKNNKDNTYYVWGCGDYDVTNSVMQSHRVVYKKCESEAALLIDFITHWSSDSHCPDVITGWNTRFFDIPYLINRTIRILDDHWAKKFSPWGLVDARDVTIMQRKQTTYEIQGISQMDYLELFKKFGHSYGPQESYKLDHIANVVLGERKLSYDEHSGLFDLYKFDYQKFIDYNIKDVELVDRLEDKLGLITLAVTMAYRGGVNYGDTFGTTAIWDAIIFRNLIDRNIVVPFAEDKIKSAYPGGFVKDPHVGMHKNVVSFDLNSLYPSIIMQYNMSPETIIDGKVNPAVTVDSMLSRTIHTSKEDNECVAAGGQFFRTDKKGILPTIIEGMYNERVNIKRAMLNAQAELQKVNKDDKQELYRIERDIAINENQQMAIKLLLNSLYGALGNRYFRFFDQRIAEAITLTGQLTIRWAELSINNYLNRLFKNDRSKDYVLAIDTDSVYVCLDDLVNAVNPSNPIDFLDKVCQEKLEPVLEQSYLELFNNLGGIENKMVMKREVIADVGIWTAKKRYILNVFDNEGVRYATPKLKIMGIEAIKSSTPGPCREALKEIFKVIVSGNESDVQQSINQFRSYFKSLPPEEIAFPRGITKISAFKDRELIYKKGTPIHVRGGLLYNKELEDKSLQQKYERIQNGEKIKFIYLRTPNPIKENVISFPAYLPEEFGLHKYINHELQFQKTFLDAIDPILEAIGWNSKEVSTLEDFF